MFEGHAMGFLDGIQEAVGKSKVAAEPAVPSGWDPRKFNDPVAIQTDWDPTHKGGPNFKTRKLVPKGPMRVEFHAVREYIAMASVFAGLGLALMFLGIRGLRLGMAEWFSVLGGALFSILGLTMLVLSQRPVAFDKSSGWFWKRWRQPRETTPPVQARAIRLSEIHALQIIRERVSEKGQGYWCYELNVVLRNASRANVIDHGKLHDIQSDAAKLAQFLGVPLWDATTQLLSGKPVLF